MIEADIAALVARYPLPDGVPDAVLNREELAEALGTSLNTVTAWINAGMPVQAIGSNGRPYELRLAHCFAWNEARKHNEESRNAEARQAITALRLALVGGKSGDSIEALDPKQRREILMAQMAHEEQEARRNKLLRREDVLEAFEAILASVRDAMEVAPDRIERADPTMSPKAVSAFVDICDGVIEDVARRIEQYVADRPERGADYMRDELFDA